MTQAGNLRVSPRGQMSLPASALHRWGLNNGGEVGFLDLGDLMLLVPGGAAGLKQQLFASLGEDDWARARAGFGDPNLANE